MSGSVVRYEGFFNPCLLRGRSVNPQVEDKVGPGRSWTLLSYPTQLSTQCYGVRKITENAEGIFVEIVKFVKPCPGLCIQGRQCLVLSAPKGFDFSVIQYKGPEEICFDKILKSIGFSIEAKESVENEIQQASESLTLDREVHLLLEMNRARRKGETVFQEWFQPLLCPEKNFVRLHTHLNTLNEQEVSRIQEIYAPWMGFEFTGAPEKRERSE